MFGEELVLNDEMVFGEELVFDEELVFGVAPELLDSFPLTDTELWVLPTTPSHARVSLSGPQPPGHF